METINLTIPTMKSAHCQMTVSNAVTTLGAKVTSVGPGKITVELGNTLTAQTVVNAIEKAGYKVN